MQPPQIKPSRGFTIGAGVMLFGLSVEILGLAVGWNFYGQGTGFAPNPYVCFMGVILTFVGLVLHIGRI